MAAHLSSSEHAVAAAIPGAATVEELSRVLHDLKHSTGSIRSSYEYHDNRQSGSSYSSLRIKSSGASLRSASGSARPRSRSRATSSSSSGSSSPPALDSPGRTRSRTVRLSERSSSASTLGSSATASLHRPSRPASAAYWDDAASSSFHSDAGAAGRDAKHNAGSGSAFLIPHLAKRARRKERRNLGSIAPGGFADGGGGVGSGTEEDNEDSWPYCTCCCDKEDCPRATRAAREWSDMQEDLRLAAEIGQALLKKHDEAVARSAKIETDYGAQRDALMSKLSSSIKESSSLQRQLAQSNLNLEAADSSNRILLHELDEVRNALSKTRKEHAKCALTVARAEKLSKELEDVRQESIAMRKREEASTSLAKRIGRRNEELVEQLKRKVEELEVLSRRDRPVDVGSDAIERAKERLRMGADVRGSGGAKVMRAEMEATEDAYQEMLQMLVQESESLKEENRYLKEMLEAKNEETAVLKEAQMPRSFGSTHGAHRRSLNLATSASVASPTTVYSPAATAYNDSAPLGDELMAAAATAHTVSSAVGQQQQQKRTDSPKPALLVSPPSRTSLLPDMPRAPTLASNASDRSSTKEKEGGDDDSEYAAGTGVAAAAASPAPAQTQALSDLSSQLSRKGSLLPRSGEKDTRTQQLSNLLDSVQRLFTRLSTADVNTLSRRLQRQHLTGDVGHLARTTLNSIMRDVEGLREHFRRLVEQEARTRDKEKDKEREDCGSSTTSGSNNKADGGSGSSESLLARREFFALIKTFKDLFVEIGRLRTCVNEVHLQPSHAAKLLQEHLGLEPMEERGLLPGAEWLSKMWAGASAPLGGGGSASAGAGVAGKAGNTTLSAGSGLQGASTGEIERAAANSPLAATQSFATRAVTLRGGASVRAAPRAEASVVSTTAVAVAVAANSAPANEAAASSPSGSTDPSDPTSLNQPRLRPNPNLGRKSLTRVQSRNLSGLFAGSVALSSPTAGGWDLVDRREASSAGTSASAALSANARLGAGLIPNRGGPMQRPLSRIVDDDEVSLHHGRSGHGGSRADDDGFRGALLERTLRPRGLSDSSIHSTFVEHGDASASGTSATLAASAAATATRPSPISRLITASSLALQVSSSGAHATARAIRADEVARTDSPALSEDSASTTGIFSGFGPSASEGKRGGDAVNTSSSSSTDGSKAPSSSTASFFPSLASLRPTASLAILGLSRTGAAGEATGAQSSSTLTNTSFSTSPSTSAHASTSLLAPSSPVDKQMGSSASSTAKEIAMPSRKGARHARKSSIGDQALSQSYAYKTMHRTQF